MNKHFVFVSFAAGLGLLATSAAGVEAAVYCKYVGVPKGCVVRPGVVYAPAPAARAVVATPGLGAPGVGVRAGVPGNRGGAVNRPGRF